MVDYKNAEDFENPFYWDAYALAVFANTLNARVDIEEGMNTIMNFFESLVTKNSEPDIKEFVKLAEELLRSGSPSLRDH